MKIPFFKNRSKKQAEQAVEVVESGGIVPVTSVPDWLRNKTLSLPAWAKVVESSTVRKGAATICIEGDTDGYVKDWLALLGVSQPDQYWLEVAYQCAKMDLQSAVVGTPYDPRTSGKPIEIKFTRAPQWALTAHSKGKGIAAASSGREARDHYTRIRGRRPF